jgi:hypothetical protein
VSSPEDALRSAPQRYELTRFVFLRGLGFVYAVAFGVACAQWRGLIGSDGLLPAARYVDRVRQGTSFLEWPTLFRLDASDAALQASAWLGLGLAVAVMLGVENALVMLALWAIDISFCHVGQIFWGYGWEILLLEAGFLAIFLCPVRSLRPLHPSSPAPPLVIWLLRWLVLRVMLGAGLIKLRGDPCWRDLSCLVYHYETQPVPGPLSPLLHHAPLWFHQLGVLFNHFVELAVPFGVFGPRRVRHVAGALIIAFQCFLIVSGNLSFLNWLTIVVCLSCFDDELLLQRAPRRLRERAARAAEAVPGRAQRVTLFILATVVACLSVDPIVNMLSPRQQMNTSFDPLHLVNSYGAFGTVGRVRNEVVLQGTLDAQLGPTTRWLDYELPCKPGDVQRAPCLITPYHYRLDWQMWFAAMSEAQREPWLIHLAYKLLSAEPAVLALFEVDPFKGERPRFVRAELYEYHFARPGEGRDATWTRSLVGEYLAPLSLEQLSTE